MYRKQTYEELELRVKELENEALEREKAEYALKKEEERYRALFQNNPVETLIVDKEAHVTGYNFARERSRGKLPKIGDVMYRDYASNHNIDMHAELMDSINSGVLKKFPEQKYKDIFLNINISPFPEGAIITSIDITARKLAEEKLSTRLCYEEGLAKCSRALLNDDVKSITEAILHLKIAADVSRVYIFENFKHDNDGLCTRQTHEVCDPEVKSEIDNPELQKISYDKDIPRWKELLSSGKHIKGSIDGFPQSERDILEPQDILSILVLPINVQNEWFGFIGFDDTKSTRIWNDEDISLLETAAEMIGIFIERSKSNKYKEDLENQLYQAQKMEAIGTLAGGMAHDFNNLLMGIQGNASLLAFDIDPVKGDSNKAKEKIENIEQIVQSGSDLTRQLLGFARGGKYEVKVTDLNKLIASQNIIFGRTRREVTIREHYNDDLWNAEVDRGQIEQVILNLYINACQAMPGGGDLIIRTDNFIIDDSYMKPYHMKPGPYIKISITDTGTGMDKKTQRRIFEPFFTTKKMSRGTGLGLASAYGIIKNHEGLINVYSEKGRGATFNIYLPACDELAKEVQDIQNDLIKGSGCILIVDDEEIILDVGTQILAKLGYKVLFARNGKEAIELYKTDMEEINLVILDMIMPDMSGSDTYDKIKDVNPQVKVLLSSGYSIDGEASMILKRGCQGFIQKPFDIKKLSMKLKEVLSQTESS